MEPHHARSHRRARRGAPAGRGAFRPRRREAPHRRVFGDPPAPPRQEGADPALRGPPRRREDVTRPLHRAQHGPPLRPHLARRRARRGRDPRPPPHLCRLAARSHHPGVDEGGCRPCWAGRGRQDCVDMRGDPAAALGCATPSRTPRRRSYIDLRSTFRVHVPRAAIRWQIPTRSKSHGGSWGPATRAPKSARSPSNS